MKKILSKGRELFKFWSVRLAALAGLAVGYMTSDPTIIPRIVEIVPESWRPYAPLILGFLTFALPTLTRGLPQSNLKETEDVQRSNV